MKAVKDESEDTHSMQSSVSIVPMGMATEALETSATSAYTDESIDTPHPHSESIVPLLPSPSPSTFPTCKDIFDVQRKSTNVFEHLSPFNQTEYCLVLQSACVDKTSLINYSVFLGCLDEHTLWIGVILLSVELVLLISLLATTADYFFVPALCVIAKALSLSPAVAGITLLAFGNGAPDVFTAYAALHGQGDINMQMGGLIGATLFVTTVVFALVIIQTTDNLPPPPLLFSNNGETAQHVPIVHRLSLTYQNRRASVHSAFDGGGSYTRLGMQNADINNYHVDGIESTSRGQSNCNSREDVQSVSYEQGSEISLDYFCGTDEHMLHTSGDGDDCVLLSDSEDVRKSETAVPNDAIKRWNEDVRLGTNSLSHVSSTDMPKIVLQNESNFEVGMSGRANESGNEGETPDLQDENNWSEFVGDAVPLSPIFPSTPISTAANSHKHINTHSCTIACELVHQEDKEALMPTAIHTNAHMYIPTPTPPLTTTRHQSEGRRSSIPVLYTEDINMLTRMAVSSPTSPADIRRTSHAHAQTCTRQLVHTDPLTRRVDTRNGATIHSTTLGVLDIRVGSEDELVGTPTQIPRILTAMAVQRAIESRLKRLWKRCLEGRFLQSFILLPGVYWPDSEAYVYERMQVVLEIPFTLLRWFSIPSCHFEENDIFRDEQGGSETGVGEHENETVSGTEHETVQEHLSANSNSDNVTVLLFEHSSVGGPSHEWTRARHVLSFLSPIGMALIVTLAACGEERFRKERLLGYCPLYIFALIVGGGIAMSVYMSFRCYGHGLTTTTTDDSVDKQVEAQSQSGSIEAPDSTYIENAVHSQYAEKSSYPPPSPRTNVFISLLGFVSSMAWISLIGNEVVAILTALGLALNISTSVLGLSLLAIGNSTGDLVSSLAVARRGLYSMAVGAIFGGPLFHDVVGLGVSFMFACLKTDTHELFFTINSHTHVAWVFVSVSMISSLVIVPLSGFRPPISYAVYLVGLYALFIVSIAYYEFE
eukprot:CFRG5601T1